MPDGFVKYTVVLPYNDVDALRSYFSEHGDEVAALILEPVACNMGVVTPTEDFLKATREVTSQHGAVLIFDEVITGFRLSRGGAQQRFGITPDMTTVGKIVGGGFPAAAFGGRADIMKVLAPDGPVYQAGTLSGNPVAMAAGIETLTQRFWEGMLSRTVLLGRAPKELIDLVGYNPVVTLDKEHADEQVRDIVEHISEYQDLVDKNRETALRMAPWEIRMKQIMEWLEGLGYEK